MIDLNDILTKNDILRNMNKYDMNEKLFHFQFTEDELKTFIEKVSMKCVLKTQHLSRQFVDDYILNPDYQITDSDKSLTFHDDVCYYQPHLKNK